MYDPRCENVFKYVQIVTASGVAFVHGANDVANAVGPLGGIWWANGGGQGSKKKRASVQCRHEFWAPHVQSRPAAHASCPC